jgi:hypothetical protein
MDSSGHHATVCQTHGVRMVERRGDSAKHMEQVVRWRRSPLLNALLKIPAAYEATDGPQSVAICSELVARNHNLMSESLQALESSQNTRAVVHRRTPVVQHRQGHRFGCGGPASLVDQG